MMRALSTPGLRSLREQHPEKRAMTMHPCMIKSQSKGDASKLVSHIPRTSEERVGNPISQHHGRLPGLQSALKENTDLCLKAAELKHEMTA